MNIPTAAVSVREPTEAHISVRVIFVISFSFQVSVLAKTIISSKYECPGAAILFNPIV
jgi:hypothetical protein